MPRQMNTPSELDAYNRLVLAENAFDAAVEEAEAFALTIRAEKSLAEWSNAAGAAYRGEKWTYSADVISAEVDLFERMLRPIRNAQRDGVRYRAKAGSLA